MIRMQSIQEFSAAIENLVRKKQMTYMEAICYHVEKVGLDMKNVPRLITSTIKERVRMEACELNLIRNNSSALPLI